MKEFTLFLKDGTDRKAKGVSIESALRFAGLTRDDIRGFEEPITPVTQFNDNAAGS